MRNRLRNAGVSLSFFAMCACAEMAPGTADVAGNSEGETADALVTGASAIAAGSTIQLTSVNSGMVLDVSGQSLQDGAAVWQWSAWGGANQHWKLASTTGGAYTLTSVNSGKCLDITGQSKANGARAQQWGCWGGANQAWRFVPVANSSAFNLVSVNSGECLDVAGFSKSQGGVVQQWSCSGAANQQWTVTQVNTTGVNPANYANPLHLTFANEPALATGAAPYNYNYTAPGAATSLYGPSGLPVATDVRQGYLGDCYFMAVLSVMADRYPHDMTGGLAYVSSNSDGSKNYLVRLYAEIPAHSQSYQEQWVPVSDRMYMQPNGTLMGAQGNVRWPAIYEKAFAKLANVTHQVGSTTSTGYQTINEGGNFEGFEAITGIAAQTSYDRNAPDYTYGHPTTLNLTQVLAGVNSGRILTSTGFINADQLAKTSGYNAGTQTLALPSGATVTVQNSGELKYDSTHQAGGARVALIAGHVFGVLSTSGNFAYIRNPWGSNPDDANNADGAFWMDIRDMQVLSSLSYVTQPNGRFGAAAAAHTR